MSKTELPVLELPTPKAAGVEPIDHISGADIEACTDHIIVLRPARPDRTPSGLEIPKSAQKPYHYGYAARVGPEVKSVARGDWISFAHESSRDVFLDNPNNTMFTIVPEMGVYCRMTTQAVRELQLVLPQTDLMDVMSRTMETAVPR